LVLDVHEKVFCADHKEVGDFYDMRGIDREQCCMIIVRPEQTIEHIPPLDAFDDLADFFNGILIPAE